MNINQNIVHKSVRVFEEPVSGEQRCKLAFSTISNGNGHTVMATVCQGHYTSNDLKTCHKLEEHEFDVKGTADSRDGSQLAKALVMSVLQNYTSTKLD